MENSNDVLQNETLQIEEVLEDFDHDLDLLGSNRERFKSSQIKSEQNEETKSLPKRGDGGDLL